MADQEAAAPLVVFKKGKIGKRRQRAKRADDSDDDGDAVIKQRAKQLKGAIVVSSKPEGPSKNIEDVYLGKGEARDRSDMGATRILEEETELHRDRRAQREAFMNDADTSDGNYKGMQGYKDWKQVHSDSQQLFCTGMGTSPRLTFRCEVYTMNVLLLSICCIIMFHGHGFSYFAGTSSGE